METVDYVIMVELDLDATEQSNVTLGEYTRIVIQSSDPQIWQRSKP